MPKLDAGSNILAIPRIDPQALAQTVLEASLNGISVYDIERGPPIFLNSRYTKLTTEGNIIVVLD